MTPPILDLHSLAEVNGGELNHEFRETVKRLNADMRDAPHIRKPRKIAVEITFNPETQTIGGQLVPNGSTAEVRISSRTPTRIGNTFRLKPDRQGQLFVLDMDADDVPGQMRIDPETGEAIEG